MGVPPLLESPTFLVTCLVATFLVAAGGGLVPLRDFPDAVLRRADPSNGDLRHVLGHRSLERTTWGDGGDGQGRCVVGQIIVNGDGPGQVLMYRNVRVERVGS